MMIPLRSGFSFGILRIFSKIFLQCRPARKNGPVARASFSTALLKAGTKSTKDSNLEKDKAKVKEVINNLKYSYKLRFIHFI